MQTQASLFDDITKIMTGALGVAQGVGEEAKTFVRTQADRFVADMDLVGRDEFEAQRQIALDAKTEAEALRERVAALEAKLDALLAGRAGT